MLVTGVGRRPKRRSRCTRCAGAELRESGPGRALGQFGDVQGVQQRNALEYGLRRFRRRVGGGYGRPGKCMVAAGVAGLIRSVVISGVLMACGLVIMRIRGLVTGVVILGNLRGGSRCVITGYRNGKSRYCLQRQGQHQQQHGDCTRKFHGTGF